MRYTYNPTGVCSRQFIIDVEDGIIKDIKIIGGCAGNTLGLSKLLQGMKVDEAIDKLRGIPCGNKGTSCPDQISKALQQIKK